MYFISGDLVSQAPTTKTPPPTFSRKQSGKSKKSESNRNKSGSGNRVVPDFDTVYSRGGITIRTQRLVADGSAISTVTIRDPTPPHSGLYNCRPANLEPAHVNLHVIQGTYITFKLQILVLVLNFVHCVAHIFTQVGLEIRVLLGRSALRFILYVLVRESY